MKDALIIFLIILVVALSCLPIFKNIHNINLNWDWLQMLSYYRAARQALFQDHQFPLRTYYFSGGYPLFSNPQDGSLNPFFIPVLIFGEVVGLKINVFLFHCIGCLGMYYLARVVMNYNRLGASFSSIVFCLAGHAHRLLIRGQDYIPASFYFFIPLALALFIKAKEHKRYLVLSVFIFTLIATQAGLYFAPLLLFIFLYALLDTFQRKDKKIVWEFLSLRNFFLVFFFSFLLGAVKFFPMLELLKRNLRSMESYNPFWGPLFPNIYKAFFLHQGHFSSSGMHWNYFYTGYAPALLTVAAIAIFWRRNVRFLILFILFALLSFGGRTPLDIFRLLWKLPLFHSIEAPTRYFVPYVIFLMALTSGSFFLIQGKLKLRFAVPALTVLTVFVAADLFFTNSTREISFPLAVPKYNVEKDFFSVKNSKASGAVSPLIPKKMLETRSWEWTRPTQYELMRQNIGKINAYVNIHLPESAVPKYLIGVKEDESLGPGSFRRHLNPDYKGEIYFLKHSGNTAAFEYFSPNTILARVRVREPDTLVLNQNYEKSWKSGFGTTRSESGLLAIDLSREGEYLVPFSYLPFSFYLGLAVSLLAAGLMLFYLKNPV